MFIMLHKLLQITSVLYLRMNEFSTHLVSRIIKNCSNDESYEDVSCEVESLFTSTSFEETINFILQRIYVCKKIKPFCKKINTLTVAIENN